jgi:hypothetical protein
MKRIIAIGLIFSFVSQKAFAITIKENILFCYSKSVNTWSLDNEYFSVIKDSAAGTSSKIKGFGSRVIVALENTTIKSSKGIVNLKRGELTVFLETQTYQLPVGSYFEIKFKKNYPPLTKLEEWLEPLKNTMMYENAEFRVFEEILQLGDIRELHSHTQPLVVRLNQMQLTDPRHSTSGKPGAGIQVANTVKFAEPVVHAVKNLSNIPLFNIVIEFKIPH